VNAADLQYVKDEIVKALEQAKTKPENPNLLAETKSYLKYSFAMRNDTPTAIAQSLTFFIWLTGNPESVNTLYAMYDKVTAEDVIRVAKRYFTNNGLTVATISPAASIEVK
jgi:zinc protease